MTCKYSKLCAVFEYHSLKCDWFSLKCQYHKEFDWYDKQVVKEHTDRIRMEQVRKLEEEFEK